MYVLPWAIYILKHNIDVVDAQFQSDVKLWAIIEIMFYFNWILSIAIFMGLSFWLNLKTVSKDLESLQKDDNLYNDKNTYDILGILKNDCY